MHKICLFAFFCLFFGSVFSQYSTSIISDRPGQANSPYTAVARTVQFQTGLALGGARTDNSLGEYLGVENVLRYGILKNFEISLLHNYSATSGGPFPVSGWNAFHVGGRFHMYTGKGLVPSLGFQCRVKLRAVSLDFRPPGTGSQFLLVTQQTFGKKLVLTTNNGLDWDGSRPQARWIYVVNLAYPLGKRWGIFLENYGSYPEGDFDTYVDGGLSFLPSPNVQLDLYGGGGKNDGVTEYFASMGISFRFRHKPLFN